MPSPHDFVLIISVLVALAAAFVYFRSFRLQSKRLVANIDFLNSTPDALLVSDINGRIIKVNKHAEELFGYTKKELLQLCVEDLMPERFRAGHIKLRDAFNTVPKERPMGQGRDLLILTKDGSEVPAEIALGFGRAKGKVTHVLMVLHDITKRKEDEETIYRLAYYDTLTGLPNRLHFNEHSQKVLDRARSGKWRFAFFLVDLDDFKRINDTLGHYAGDDLLKHIAHRLNKVVEQRCEGEEGCHCFAARLGGDEFVLIIEQLEDIKQAELLAESIFVAFETPVIVEQQEIYVKLSVGIGLYPHDGSSITTLLKSADLALYTAKDKGKNQYHFHEVSMNTKLMEHFEYENAIRYFIETGDFHVHYQPIIDIKCDKICCAEALFRGDDARYSNMHFERLIHIAEETGMIPALGRAILRKVCEDCVACMKLGKKIKVAVNVSIRELNESDFAENVISTLEETGLAPTHLSIEVIESLFMVNYSENIRKLQKLKKLGVMLSIDDFGKGYSSMSYLRRLPVDRLKIDKEFIDHVDVDQKSEEIVRGITLMAHALGMEVCAEGVETDSQFRLLRSIGVDQVQGFLTGRPMPVENFIKLLENN